MAWKTPAGQKKPAQTNPKNGTKAPKPTSFPGLKQPEKGAPGGGGQTKYEELQQNEVMVLQAIYGDDFIEQKPAHGAWKKSAEPCFDIRIKASSDDELAITLGVVLVATYPKSPPLLTIKEDDGLRESTKFKIQKFVETQPKLFATEEQEMMDRIVEGIRDILEDAAQIKAQGLELPSLEEERTAHEAEAAAKQAKLAQDEKELEDRKKLQETQEEERVLGDMLQEELKRQRTKAKESRMKSRTHQPLSPLGWADENPQDSDDSIIFDQICRLTDPTGNPVLFNKVTRKELFCMGPITTVYKVKPVLAAKQLRPTLALKQVELKSGKDAAQFKKQLQGLESVLELVKKLRHRNVLEIIDFRIDREVSDADAPVPSTTSPPIWTATILLPLAQKGPLDELLELAGQIDVSKARSWVADLLEALGYLHNNGIIHQDLHPGNVLLFREPTGDIVPKIADAGYQRDLHNICTKQALTSTRAAKSAYWFPPEIASVSKPQYTQKTDVWDFGIVVLQMLFGLDVLQKYHSPAGLMESLALSSALRELVSKLFKSDAKRRPRAFDLGNSEFLATDAPVFDNDDSAIMAGSLISLPQSLPQRQRRTSTNTGGMTSLSRYQQEYVEEARLGKGGFGEVVRARNMLNGQLYAIKKITQRSQETLSEIIKEVRLLSRLNHPAVVRYYHTWLEEVPYGALKGADSSTDGPSTVTEDETETDDEDSHGTVSRVEDDMNIVFAADDDSGEVAEDDVNIEFTDSQSRGLDFMSSSGHPYIEFGYDSGEGDEEDDDDDDDQEDDEYSDDASPQKTDPRSVHSPVKKRALVRRQFQTIMYISMEYCEKKTLRNLIDQDIFRNSEEVWRLFRQTLEGLVHIHGLNIVHRDLKPENIFITGADGLDNVKIGDFGLATSGQLLTDKSGPSADVGDLTRSVGTTAYIAPEIRTTGTGSYTAKVDMYSLGVIFFEMSYQSMTKMERALVLEKIRQSPPILPSDFESSDKNHTDVVLSLLNHNPKERPSSAELLKSGKVPDQMESETITRALAGLADPSSPYYRRVLDTLFAKQNEQTKDYAWDMSTTGITPAVLMRQYIVRQTLVAIFRRHGAIEASRTCLYPKSSHYGGNVVELVDRSGTVLQLPFDLVLGHARSLARVSNGPLLQQSYSFGNIFRDRLGGGQPIMFGEVDFDIVTADTFDLALKEAEVIKVLDEICSAFPTTASTPMCFYLGHSHLLQCIFDFCGIEKGSRRATAETLSKLNVRNYPWSKIRAELRSEYVGISATSVDELQRFDFRDTPGKAQTKLKSLFESSEIYAKAAPTLAHLKEVSEYAKRFGISRKIYISPLSSINEAFFKDGILFSCLYDKKVKDVFAAGGRYDSLIKEHRPKIGGRFDERHAVGFSLNWEKQLAQQVPKSAGKAFLKKAAEEETQGIFSTKRCDVLVASFDQAVLRSDGVELLGTLWANDFSAELARDARSPEQLLYGIDSYNWVVVIKKEKMLKVKTISRKDAQDVDLPIKDLITWLRTEIRNNRSLGLSSSSLGAVPSEAAPVEAAREQEVRVLVAQTKSKKFNRHAVVGDAQAAAARLVTSFLDGPIAAIETTDAVMDLIRTTTSLSDPDSWRRVEQAVGGAEKQYVRDVHDMLRGWRDEWAAGKGPMHAFVYNFRTGGCLYYDLQA
ncbi:serine/threonine-protein kinase gcn2 [Thozetella sp. PMI_491]|nr:serine/threonine-protein kinase gcn2 [Thozetella sp. PMI_491]